MKIKKFNENSNRDFYDIDMNSVYYIILGMGISDKFKTYEDAVEYMYKYFNPDGVIKSYGESFTICKISSEEMTKDYFNMWYEEKKYNL